MLVEFEELRRKERRRVSLWAALDPVFNLCMDLMPWPK
jgi:hypothetical protein